MHQTLLHWCVKAVIDGEIIVVNEQGLPDFGALQLWRSEADGQLAFFVFDILWLEGYSVMQLPIEERRELLRAIIPETSETVKISEYFDTTGKEAFALAEKLLLEGIMAKKVEVFILPQSEQKTG